MAARAKRVDNKGKAGRKPKHVDDRRAVRVSVNFSRREFAKVYGRARDEGSSKLAAWIRARALDQSRDRA